MYLYYVVATEPPKPRKAEKEDVHALICSDDDDFISRCSELFIKCELYHAKHKLNKDW